MTDKEFNPEDFKAQGTEQTVANTFEESIRTIDELPPDKRAEYEKLAASEETPEPETEDQPLGTPQTDEESLEVLKKLTGLGTEAEVKLTDEMREMFVRCLVANQAYEHTFKYKDDAISLTFRTLSVREHDAVAEAIADYSKNEGFETSMHLKFLNYKYVVSCSLAGITVKDEEVETTVHVYNSPLKEYDIDFVEKEIRTKKMDGTTRTKVVKSEVRDRDRILMAYTDRFDDLDSNLYNLILNSHTEFDKQVNALAMEMYNENFTQENSDSSI